MIILKVLKVTYVGQEYSKIIDGCTNHPPFHIPFSSNGRTAGFEPVYGSSSLSEGEIL